MKKLGDYILGRRPLTLYIDYTNGNGRFESLNSKMIIGISRDSWCQVVETVLHESLEWCLADNNCRFLPDFGLTDAHDTFLFIFTHPQLSEICAQLANFMEQCLPDISKEYNELQKKTRTKKSS